MHRTDKTAAHPAKVIPSKIRIAAGRALELVRNGPRIILWTPPNLGFGNHLYLWLWAFRQREQGVDAWVLEDARMSPWLTEFPTLRNFTISRNEVGLRDRRTVEWAQTWGWHYTAEELFEFTNLLVRQQPFLRRINKVQELLGENTLVINVRRGDYYSVSAHRSRYGMNIVGFVEAAVARALEATPIDRIQYVSDDLDWCSANLDTLSLSVPASFTRIGNDASDDLAVLASAKSLIMTNSTFSYWGGHLNGALNNWTNSNQIIAPNFHARGLSKDDAPWHLNPAWTIIREIRGGWDENPSEQ